MSSDQPDKTSDNDPAKDDTSELMKAREAHYAAHFGPINQPVMHSKDRQDPQIDVYQFEPTEERPYWTLITGGMSDDRQPALVDIKEDVAPRAEIMLYVHEPQQWMFHVLKSLAELPFESGSFLHWHHTVPSRVSMTGRESLLTSFFFLPPYFESDEFDSLKIDGDRVNILWLVPITDAEREFAVANGPEALEGLMVENELDPVVFEPRESLV